MSAYKKAVIPTFFPDRDHRPSFQIVTIAHRSAVMHISVTGDVLSGHIKKDSCPTIRSDPDPPLNGQVDFVGI
jgi:hypothetical protein